MKLLPPPEWMSTRCEYYFRWCDGWRIFMCWHWTGNISSIPFKRPKRIKSYACHMEQPVDFNDACTREMMGRSWPSSSSDMSTRRWIT